MAACNPGAKYEEDASDYTICPWSTETGHCVFLDPVPITDIKGTQIRVHSDFTQDAITSCEKATSHTVPFFSLQFTEFGHPMYEGLFPACTNAAVLLKKQVESFLFLTMIIKKLTRLQLTLSTLVVRVYKEGLRPVLIQYCTGQRSGTRTSWLKKGLNPRSISINS